MPNNEKCEIMLNYCKFGRKGLKTPQFCTQPTEDGKTEIKE